MSRNCRLIVTFALWLIIQILGTVHGEIHGTDQTELPDYCYDVLYSDADIERYVYKDYLPNVRPVVNASDTVKVSFGLVFERIVDVFERERIIEMEGYFILEWVNELINWQNVVPFNCSKKLIAPNYKIWIPDISLVNDPVDKYALELIQGHKIEITYDGTCDFYPSGNFNASCSLSLRYFPFDEQVCVLRFAGWSYSSDMQQLRASAFPVGYDHFQEHMQWSLYNAEALNAQNYNPITHKTYDEVQFVLYLRRKPAYYLINIVVPVMLISFVEITTFAMPITHGIKINISFTTLLAFGVFQLMMLADMPRDSSGGSLPLLTIYLDLTMAYIGTVLVGESIIFMFLRRAEPGMPPPPDWIFTPITAFGHFLGIESHHVKELLHERRSAIKKREAEKKNRHQPNDFHLPLGDGSEFAHDLTPIGGVEAVLLSKKELGPLPARLARFSRHQHHKRHHDRIGNEHYQRTWMVVAEVIERTLFLVYISALIFTPIIIYAVLPPLQPASVQTTNDV